MYEITITSADEQSRNIAVEETSTIRDICSMPAVIEFFDAEPQEIRDALDCVNGADVIDSVRGIFLSASLEEGAVVGFDLDCAEFIGDDAPASGVPVAPGTPGTVKVYTSGGLASAEVSIVSGETTLDAVINHQSVKVRSGMSDDQIRNCNILWNENSISAADAKSVRVSNGDVIELTLPSAARKGHDKG